MSAKAKQERDDLEMKLLAMKMTIEDLCGAPSPTKRLVKKRREELRVIWEKMQSKHVNYCRAVNVGMESPESVEFLKRVGKTYNEAEEIVTATLGGEDATEDEVRLKRMKKRVKSLQTEIDLDIPHNLDLADTADNAGAHEQAISMLGEAEDKLKRYLEDSCEAEDTLMMQQVKECVEVEDWFSRQQYVQDSYALEA